MAAKGHDVPRQKPEHAEQSGRAKPIVPGRAKLDAYKIKLTKLASWPRRSAFVPKDTTEPTLPPGTSGDADALFAKWDSIRATGAKEAPDERSPSEDVLAERR